jgi:uncharacterized protein YabN with tetrapyrrole methylase and pyrophosphatase domain
VEKRGSLIVAGAGIRILGQLTTEAIAAMKSADRLLYLLTDSIGAATIQRLNPATEDLSEYYVEGQRRLASYEVMVQRIVGAVRDGLRTCVAFYGHPGVFAYPTHEAIRRARAEGYEAKMLPGISAEDCLFADLGIDPATHGCQSFDATNFLVCNKMIDPSASVILWQVGVVGDPVHRRDTPNSSALPLLIQRLCDFFPPDHLVQIYEASFFPQAAPLFQTVTILDLTRATLRAMSTLYIPPSQSRQADPTVLGKIQQMISAESSSP